MAGLAQLWEARDRLSPASCARTFAAVLALFVLGTLTARGQFAPYPPADGLIPGPPKASDFSSWIEDLNQWREETLIRLGYDGAEYDRAEMKWAERAFIQPQMMAHDRYFFDPASGKYTVDRYLADLKKRYDGIDAVLIWATYPNLGIDGRNQFDLVRDLPGGIAALKAMVDDFHRRGVRVLFPYSPWDRGTRREDAPDWQVLSQLMSAIGADGLNGDTMYWFPRAFRTASDAAGHPLAFEPQVEPDSPGEELAWDNLSWNDWIVQTDRGWKYPFIPSVIADKWLEPRHMVNVTDRWARDKADNLQHAFFNGVGYESWENIWGIWNQIDGRDAEALRRIAAIERATSHLLTSHEWEPHTPVLQPGVFASKFPANAETLWTLVNRNEYAIAGRQIRLVRRPEWHYYDLWHGIELQPDTDGSQVILSFEVEPRGYGAVLATSRLSPEEQQLLDRMLRLSAQPLRSFSSEWHFLPQHLVDIAPTKKVASAPEGMVAIPEDNFNFSVAGTEIEGDNRIGVDVQMPWEDSPRREHFERMHLKRFYLDRTLVTNDEFAKFLAASGYHPRDDHNFLRDWRDGKYPDGRARQPVTWVSLEDARAYASWAGKRLPHEWEWQYAAQGTDGRLYPWGNQWDSAAVAPTEKGRILPPPPDVATFPRNTSPFSVMDLVGSVWQWTDEYEDEHTRAAILRGGSYYQPQGSLWYFPQAYRLNQHSKYLLMAPGIDRAATIGFRCAKDAQ